MSRETIISIGIAMGFYMLGGWTLHDQVHAHEREDELHPPSVEELAAGAYAPEAEPAKSDYSVGLGLIGFGTLVALCRELVVQRRGAYRRDIGRKDLR